MGSTKRLISPNSSNRVPNVTAPMISHSVISMLYMPPRDNSRSMSAYPDSIEKPVAIAFQPDRIPARTRSGSGTPAKVRTMCGCVKMASAAAKSAAVMRASDAGTLRADITTSNINGSRFHQVMLKTVPSSLSSTPVFTAPTAGGHSRLMAKNSTNPMMNAGIDVHACCRICV